MAQNKYDLFMVYQQKPDGNLALVKFTNKAFGFSDETLCDDFMKALVGQYPNLSLVKRRESVMVDERFPLPINPIEIGENGDIFWKGEPCT